MKALKKLTFFLLLSLLVAFAVSCDEETLVTPSAELLCDSQARPVQLLISAEGKSYAYDVHTTDGGEYYIIMSTSSGQSLNIAFTVDGSGNVTVSFPENYVLKTEGADDAYLDGQKVSVLYNNEGKIVLVVSDKMGNETVTYKYDLYTADDGVRYIVVKDEKGEPASVLIETLEEDGKLSVKFPDGWTFKAPAVSLESMPEPPHVHKFGEWETVKESTCLENGEKARECSCGEKETEELVLAAHTDGEWVTDKEPSCTEKGSKHLECALCKSKIRTEDIAELGHVESVWVVDKEPTCTELGSRHVECTVCKANIRSEHINALKHTYTEKKVEPTKKADGYIDYTCACGDYYRETLYALGSQGLEYEMYKYSSKKSVAVIGIGTCKDTDLVIPAYIDGYPVQEISEGAFRNCNTLKSVTILGSASYIGDFSFENCKKLESITIGEGARLIGTFCFNGSDSLKQITLPKSVTGVRQAGLYAPNLKLIIYKGTKDDWSKVDLSWEEEELDDFSGIPDKCIIRCTDGDIVYRTPPSGK